MLGRLTIAFVTALLLAPGLLGQQPPKFVGRRLLPVPPAAPVAASAAPLPPEQLPASPPEVQFQQGQLTILASNSTLGDILRAVRERTGAAVDVPGNATERVVGQFGPGPARDVLTSLLNGSHFNYLLVGSADNSSSLDRVILTSRSGAGNETQPAPQQASAGMPPNQPGPAMVAPQPMDSDEAVADDSTPDQPDNADADDQGNQGQADDQQQQPQQAQPFGQPGGVKTPEQLLQELQQRQQQMQQQGVPNAPGYPPTPGMPRPQQ